MQPRACHVPSQVPFSLLARAVHIAAQSTAPVWNSDNKERVPVRYVVSVGSGDMQLENLVRSMYGLPVTTVDIDPMMNAHFPDIHIMRGQMPAVVGNCVVLLIWPDTSGYDWEAIMTLQPVNFLVLYEGGVDGQSMSLRLRQWLAKQADDTSGEVRYRLMQERTWRIPKANPELHAFFQDLMRQQRDEREAEMQTSRGKLGAAALEQYTESLAKLDEYIQSDEDVAWMQVKLQWYVRRGTSVIRARSWEDK